MTYQSSSLVDAYIAQFGAETKDRLSWVRSVVQATFPKTIEDIGYDMPTYRPAPGKRGVVHFAASQHHIGIYGIFDPKSNAPIHDKMQPYRTGRGTLQFSNDKPLPKRVIREILAYHAGTVDM